MNSKTGADSHDKPSNQLLANGIASSSSPNISHQFSNGQARQKSNLRAASAKYHDVAATILRGSRDVDEVFLNTSKNGDLKKLEQLLNQSGSIGLDIDCKDKRTGNTALIWAAKRGHVKVVEALLRHGAEVTLCNHEAQTALETAHSSVRTILLDWVEMQTQINEKLLMQASWQGNLSVVRKILTSEKRHLNVNCQSAEGITPLMLVTRDVQLFERLSAQLNRYYSPVQVAKELIKANADVNATDSDGRSCLHYISMSKASCADKLVSVLISGGMAIEAKDKNLFTPIHLASQLGNTNNVLALAEGGSDVNAKGFAGSTPLHLTAYNDHQKTASTLLSVGADVSIQDDRGYTALDVAKSKKMKNLLKEAWTEATGQCLKNEYQSVKELNSKNSVMHKKNPEVIFDDLVRSSPNSPLLKPGSAKTRVLSNVEKCKQAEKKILQEVEALKAAHPVLSRETTRILGTTRSKILPQIGRSSSPVPAHAATSPDLDLTLEETRQQLLSRGRSVSEIKLGYRQSAMSGSTSSDDFIGQFNMSRSSLIGNHRQHQRSDSEPFTPSFKNLAESCDLILSNPQGNLKMKPMHSPTTQTSFFITDKKSSPDDDVFSPLEPQFDFLRSRSILKEEFIIEESRPKDFMSKSDPTSSTSSLSTPSPRDMVQHPLPKSYKYDPLLETLVEQQASDNFALSPAELRNSPTRPQIRTPRQIVRHRSDNSLSSSLDSDAEADNKSKRILPRAGNVLKKSFGSETSSSSDSISMHKSQSLEMLSPRSHSQLNQSTLEKPFSLSDDNISKSSTNLQLVASRPTDIPKLDLSANPKSEKRTSLKQPRAVKPFSGKARMLISADIDNWESKNVKLYAIRKKAEKINSSSIPPDNRKGEKTDSSSANEPVHHIKTLFVNSQSVPDFVSSIAEINLASQDDAPNANRTFFVVTKESELLSNLSKKKLEEKVINSEQKRVAAVKPPVMASTKRTSADMAAVIERTIMKNQKDVSSPPHKNLSVPSNEGQASDAKIIESAAKNNSTKAETRKSLVNNVKENKMKRQGQVRPTSSKSQSNVKPNASKTLVAQSNKNNSKEKLENKSANVVSGSQPNEIALKVIVQAVEVQRNTNSNSGMTHRDSFHNGFPATHTKIEVPITTPMIVDPYEEFPQSHIKLIENPTTDAVVKLRKTSVCKTKKSASSKRPISGSSRQSSAGKKRASKGKEVKLDVVSRPKSTKKNGRLKKGKGDEDLDELYNLAESDDVVLVSGIGWQLSTSCIKSQLGSEVILHKDITQSCMDNRPPATESENRNILEAFREKIMANSPRFLETKHPPTETRMQTAEDDGCPAMYLDMTQNQDYNFWKEDPPYGDEWYSPCAAADKLATITEMSISPTADKISTLHRSYSSSQGTADRGAGIVPTSKHSSSGNLINVNDNASHFVNAPSAYSIKQRLKESHSKIIFNTDLDIKIDKVSDCELSAHVDDDNIEEVIEEILSSTTSSLSSTLKSSLGQANPKTFSGSHTLTYGDRRLLSQMSSLTWGSPFHAQTSTTSETANQQTSWRDLRSSGDGKNFERSTQHGNTVQEVKVNSPAEETRQAERTDFSIPVSAKPPLSIKTSARDETESHMTSIRRSSSTKFYRRREQIQGQNLNDEEAKQLAKVINSFKQMELTTSSGRQDTNSAPIKSPNRQSSGRLATSDTNFASRPGSTNTSFKIKGKFRELKESKVDSVSPTPDNQARSSSNRNEAESNEHTQVEALLSGTLSGVNTVHGDNKLSSNEFRRESLACSDIMSEVKGADDTIQWKKGNILGRGAFGTVWCGLTNEGQLIAVKQIELTTMNTPKAKLEYEKVQEEVELLKTLEHQNIVGYLGTSLEDNIVSIFMQFIPGGSLASILARFGALEESVFRRYTEQILKGVKYLHDNDVIHRDLKGANVMLMPTGVIKLIDFGCAKRMCINLSISQAEILKSMKGTPFWMAPEVVNETGHGKKSDIWSIGCTVFEMATRNPPWSDMNPMAAIFAIGSATRPVPTLGEKFSREARSFVLQCMTRDQNERPDATRLLKHAFITKKIH